MEIHRVYAENLFVYGADKVWTQLNRENIRVARCTVERLMRAEGLTGARRGKAFTITTHTDDRLQRPADLVERKFRAPAPDRLWVADLTYVKTHVGRVYASSWSRSARSTRIRRRSSSTSTRGWSWAGKHHDRCAPISRSTRWRWRCGTVDEPAATSTSSSTTAAAASKANSTGRRNTSR